MLDIIDIPLQRHQPGDYQQENWLLDPKYYWRKVAKYPWNDLKKLSEKGGTLWQNEYHTKKGLNDRIPLDQAKDESSSLKLVHVDKLRLNVFAPGEAFGDSKRRVQGQFRFAYHQYALWVTDPDIERAYLKRKDGNFNLGECFLTISLGEPYDSYCYKLIAGVMEKPR